MIPMLPLIECITCFSWVSLKEIEQILMHQIMMISFGWFHQGILWLIVLFLITFSFIFGVTVAITISYSDWYVVIFSLLKKVLNISNYSVFDSLIFFFVYFKKIFYIFIYVFVSDLCFCKWSFLHHVFFFKLICVVYRHNNLFENRFSIFLFIF